jgi:hypothetical protein
MMRAVISQTIARVEMLLDQINLPGHVGMSVFKHFHFKTKNKHKDIDLKSVRDVEDKAIGAGILSQNEHMFNDTSQVAMT